MVYSIDIYKSLNIDTRTVMKNLEIIKFIHDHLKTKKMRKHAVKKLYYLLRYVPNQYMIQQMYNEAVLENAWMLEYVLDCEKNHEMGIKPLRITFMH